MDDPNVCGIAGCIDLQQHMEAEVLAAHATKMTRALAHRGPDGEGLWLDAAAGLAFGHRRLAIIDLSPAGHQPMISGDSRHVIVYNGEIYNATELRAELRTLGYSFRGYSDTEVILEGCAAWGVDRCVERLLGMFAFALYDRTTRTLVLVRDRMGIKPLYWARFPGLFLFGSELKALRAHPGWTPEVDRDALVGFMRCGYVGGPRTIYAGVQQLEPGRILALDAAGGIATRAYWDLRTVVRNGRAEPFAGSAGEAVATLEELLRDAVRRRMIADVPLGAFLSGGIDSSTVTALMQAESPRPVRTFSIGFDDPRFDEAAHARAVAAHLRTEHTELYAQPADALELVFRVPEWFDEPFADSSQLPTFLLAALTREQVTVALSGDGGDELFAGYQRYTVARQLWQRLQHVPRPLQRVLGRALRDLPPALWIHAGRLLPSRLRQVINPNKLPKLALALSEGGSDALYRQIVSYLTPPTVCVRGGREPQGPLWDSSLAAEVPEFTRRMQLIDLLGYLPDDILTKVDRTTMAVGLEARVPLLDHRVVAFACSLPLSLQIRDGQAKWLLRQVLTRHVPATLVERPKTGFVPPLAAWLRGALRDWAETLLDAQRLRDDGFLEPAPVRALWMEHLSGRRDWSYGLWAVLMFQAWREHHLVPPAPLTPTADPAAVQARLQPA